MKLRIRLTRRTKSNKKLQTPIDETEAETSRSAAFLDDVSSLSGDNKSLPACPVSCKDPRNRKAPSREPSLEAGKGFDGLEKFFKKYDSIVDSNSSLSCDGGEIVGGPDEPQNSKKKTISRSTSRHSGKKRHETTTARTVSSYSRDSPARRGIQRHNSASAMCIKVKSLKKQLKKAPSRIRLRDFFKEYDEITSNGGAKSVTGW